MAGTDYQDGDRPVPADVRARLAAGMTDEEIRIELGISAQEFADLRKAMVTEELQSVRHRPAEEIYVDYRVRMFRIANDLQDVNLEARRASQYTAAMGALKAEATVIDRVIDRGQELGVLPRASRSHTVVGGIVLGAMTDPELAGSLKELKNDRGRLRKEYGDVPLHALPEPDIYPDVVEASAPEPAPVQPERRKVR